MLLDSSLHTARLFTLTAVMTRKKACLLCLDAVFMGLRDASSHNWINSEWGKCLAIRANRGEVGLSVGKGKTVLNQSLEAQSATGF